MLKFNFSVVLLVLAFFGLSMSFTPPYDPSPFTSIGFISGMTLDSTTNPLSGGTVTVDGSVMVIPANTLVTLPSITVAWPELFVGGAGQAIGFEANIIGNSVGGKLIAGLVFIAQESLQTTQGFISAIDLTVGHFTVDGVTCVINDPLSVYGPGLTSDPLWTSDAQNPSIHAQNGFPMCIPRSATSDDPLCPAKNRPKNTDGTFKTIFTFADPSTIASGDTTTPDPRIMAPLVVGDYVIMQGTFKNGVYEVYSLNANLGIFTAPGTKPAYVTVESVNFGITSPATGEVAETRAVAWTTDLGSTLNWFAMDVDPCTGAVTERQIATGQPNGAGVVPVGRTVYREGKTAVSPATRQVGFRLSTGNSTGPQGIIVGQYIQPVFVFIFPELLTFGNPALVNDFTAIPFLAQGSGPYVPGNPLTNATCSGSPVIVGQLNPWPGATAPAPKSCAAVACPSTAPASTTLATSVISSTSTASTPPTSSTTAVTPFFPDVISGVTATGKNQKGVTTVVINAQTNSTNAHLSFTLQGTNPVANTSMTFVSGSGSAFLWTFTLSVKTKPTTVTVGSDKGAKQVTAAVA